MSSAVRPLAGGGSCPYRRADKPVRLLAALALATCTALPARANDYPTAERVTFVLECLRDFPGPEYEMIQKCSCALDAIAERLPYDRYVEASTVSKAVTIAGERGGTLRENEQAQGEAREYRSLYREARKRCLFRP